MPTNFYPFFFYRLTIFAVSKKLLEFVVSKEMTKSFIYNPIYIEI
jgi:hypothetical protein